MGRLIRDSIARVVSPSPEACFRLLVESRDVGAWWRGVVSTLSGPYPWSASTRLSFRARLGRPAWVAEVREVIPYQLVEVYYTEGDFRGAEAWEFEPVGEGARIAHVWRGIEGATPLGRALLLSPRFHRVLFGPALDGMARALAR